MLNHNNFGISDSVNKLNYDFNLFGFESTID